MCKKTIGSATICGNPYPFCYEPVTEKITIHMEVNPIEVPNGTDKIIGHEFGRLTGGNTFYKLSVPIANHCTVIDAGGIKQIANETQIIPIEYSIYDYQENCIYTEMRFQFPELDYFIPSINMLRILDKEFVFSRIRKPLYAFDINYHDTVVSVSFNTSVIMTSKVKATVETTSEVLLKFPETNDIDYLKGLYFSVRAFFAFVCNRRNIGLRDAILIGTYPIKTIKENKVVDALGQTRQRLVFGQKYLEPLEDKKQVEKTPSIGLFADKIGELFQLFFAGNTDGVALIGENGVHPSSKYRNLIDLEQSLNITSTFEYYARTLLPEISSQETMEFWDDMSALVEKYIETASKKKKRKAKEFKNLLRPQVPLEAKIEKSYIGYSTWTSLKPILSEWFGDDVSDLANAANKWRNELAHGKREYRPDINVIKAIRLIEHINYCVLLRHAGYKDEQIKSILWEILTR